LADVAGTRTVTLFGMRAA